LREFIRAAFAKTIAAAGAEGLERLQSAWEEVAINMADDESVIDELRALSITPEQQMDFKNDMERLSREQYGIEFSDDLRNYVDLYFGFGNVSCHAVKYGGFIDLAQLLGLNWS
jgi:hypothetical protein